MCASLDHLDATVIVMAERFLSEKDLEARGLGKSRAQRWRDVRDGKFPRPVKLSGSRNAWLESEVDAWCAAKLAERDGKEAA